MFVYILFSDQRSRYYVGQTADIDKRLKRHNKGNVPSTRYGVPWKLVLQISVSDKTEIAQVASISANSDTAIGDMIAEAMDKVGKEGVISLEEGKGIVTELEITEGMKLEKGFISPYFITNTEKMEALYDNPYILLTDKRITLVQQDLLPILEQITKTKRPLLIIAEDVEKEALATLILNKLRGIVNLK